MSSVACADCPALLANRVVTDCLGCAPMRSLCLLPSDDNRWRPYILWLSTGTQCEELTCASKAAPLASIVCLREDAAFATRLFYEKLHGNLDQNAKKHPFSQIETPTQNTGSYNGPMLLDGRRACRHRLNCLDAQTQRLGVLIRAAAALGSALTFLFPHAH